MRSIKNEKIKMKNEKLVIKNQDVNIGKIVEVKKWGSMLDAGIQNNGWTHSGGRAEEERRKDRGRVDVLS
jgi:hypothetical protein